MKVRCPNCGMLLKFRDENLGRHGKCPRCRHEIVAEWGDVVRHSPPPPEQPSRLWPMPIVWGGVAVFGLGAAALIAGSVVTGKPAPSLNMTPPVAQAAPPSATPVPMETVTPAAAEATTVAPAVATQAVTTAQAQPEVDSRSARLAAGRSAGPVRSPTYSLPTPRITRTPLGDTTASGKPIYVGPRGGQYHYSASGRKVYERHRR
jgi:hypothetical protein